MTDTHNDTRSAETVAIRACGSCGSGLLETNKFCRNCGARQSAQCLGFVPSGPFSTDDVSASGVAASRSSARAGADAYHPVSGPLVKAVVASVSSRDTVPLHGRLFSSSVLALISIPIWIMIVLLSPIDAYVAARTFSRVTQ